MKALPIMPCFQWDTLYRWSCGAIIVMKHIYNERLGSILLMKVCFITPPHDVLNKISHLKQCIMGSASYLLLIQATTLYIAVTELTLLNTYLCYSFFTTVCFSVYLIHFFAKEIVAHVISVLSEGVNTE